MIQIDKSPFHRKAIIPWYATDTACLIKTVVMFVFVLFGLDGIKVARQMEAYNEYVWVPLLLIVLSGIVFVTTLIRLISRYAENSAI